MSNVSWPATATRQAYELLQERGFAGVEVAPGLLFGSQDDPRRPSAGAIRRAQADIEGYGLAFVAMQSLHFGLGHAQLFGDESSRAAFIDAIDACCSLARRLDIGVLTIGSAPNRSYSADRTEAHASTEARECLLPAADRAYRAGLKLAVEPIPAAYGTNFLNTLEEALAFVRSCDHPALRLNFDTGAVDMSGEIGTLAEQHALARAWIGHIHVGARGLRPVSREDAWIGGLAQLIAEDRENSLWMSAEMRPDSSNDLLAARTAADALVFHTQGARLPSGTGPNWS